MPYIGNTVQTQGFTPAIDYFSGNGVTVTFTLSRPVVGVAQMIVAVDNVIQNPSTAFTVSGSSITFTSAPLSGTNNIWVEYTSLITTYNAISQDPSVIGDITASGGYLAVGDFGNSYIDGTIVDYVTGNARITTGPADGLTIYNGGTSARTALAAWDTSGNLTNTGAGSFAGVSNTSTNTLNLYGTGTGGNYAFIQNTTGRLAIGVESSSGSTIITGAGANEASLSAKNTAINFSTNNGSSIAAKIDTSNNFAFNSGYGSAATVYGCRAWVCFNGTSGSIYASGNVSSVTRHGAGGYTMNFTNSMPDANYSASAISNANPTGWGSTCYENTRSTSGWRIQAVNNQISGAGGDDGTYVCMTVFR